MINGDSTPPYDILVFLYLDLGIRNMENTHETSFSLNIVKNHAYNEI
jgi:hypothetical protein